MRKFSLLLVITLLVLACGSIKDKQLLKTNTFETEATAMRTDLSIVSGKQEVITDSSRQDYTLEILPAGVFTYDAVNGYKGMASQLVWKGKVQQQTLVKRNENQLITANQRQTQARETTRTEQEEYIKKSTRSSALWLWLALAIGILLVWIILIYRLRKKFTMH